MEKGHKQFWLIFSDEVIAHPAIRLLGWANFVEPVLGAVIPHHHCNNFELHFLLKGRLDIYFDSKVWNLRPGEAVIAAPYEIHGGMNSSLQKGQFFWMQLKAEYLTNSEREILESLISKRKFRVSNNIFQIIERLVCEQISPGCHSKTLEAGLLSQLIVTLAREVQAEENLDTSLVSRAKEEIMSCMSNPPTQVTLAKKLKVKPSKLLAEFKKQTGSNLGAWIISERLNIALELLKEGKSASEIARRLGYSSPQNFMTTFRKEFGFTPSNYKKQVRPHILETTPSPRICDFPQSSEYPPQDLSKIGGSGKAQIITGLPPRTLDP